MHAGLFFSFIIVIVVIVIVVIVIIIVIIEIEVNYEKSKTKCIKEFKKTPVLRGGGALQTRQLSYKEVKESRIQSATKDNP